MDPRWRMCTDTPPPPLPGTLPNSSNRSPFWPDAKRFYLHPLPQVKNPASNLTEKPQNSFNAAFLFPKKGRIFDSATFENSFSVSFRLACGL
ncbi:hypothetical protein CEXT_152381 [Caerostris extrusa]|uniref:Uncharacterized protein n=1 Tax=Caerostris extrusa TaxID=172846 RepID=A0AAV4WQY3_CAEEX|nr:hypothetical protein CEXT_152381 [Caerostris extrusa]